MAKDETMKRPRNGRTGRNPPRPAAEARLGILIVAGPNAQRQGVAAHSSLERAASPAELAVLFRYAPWARHRTTRDIERMLSSSLLVVCARKNRKLVGFGRAWGDGVFRAVIDDVIVLPTQRGKGVGRAIVQTLAAAFAGLEEIALSCRPAMAGFYRRFGFSLASGICMKKKARPRPRRQRATSSTKRIMPKALGV